MTASVQDSQDDALADWRFVPATGQRRAHRPVASAGQAVQLAARELQLVLTVLFVLFVTGEAWQVFGRLSGLRYAVLLALFAVLAAILGRASSRRQTAVAVGDPRFQRTVPDDARATLGRRLRWRTWFEILVVGIAVAAAFLALGVIIVDEALTREWAALGDDRAYALVPLSELWQNRFDGPLEVYELEFGGLVVSEPLLRVVGVLGGFAALLFAVEALVDADLRADVTGDLLDEWAVARAAWEERPEAR